MYRRAFLALAACAGLAAPVYGGDDSDAMADPVSVQLTASQIEALLAGNTIVGTWSGSKYTQYYGPDGYTVYMPEGGQPDEGKWRVKEETDQYDSWWESTGWTPYTVVMTNEGYAWVNGDELEHFDVFAGRQEQ